jgi:type IV pilus assembly protein PilE
MGGRRQAVDYRHGIVGAKVFEIDTRGTTAASTPVGSDDEGAPGLGAALRRAVRRAMLTERTDPDQRGFTIVELAIALTVLVLLAATAVPVFTDYLRRSKLTDAFTTMATYRTRMDHAFQDENSYGVDSACAIPAPPASSYFSFVCKLGEDSNSYVLTASGIGGMDGYAYSIDDGGNQRTTAFPGAVVPATCWLSRKGDC